MTESNPTITPDVAKTLFAEPPVMAESSPTSTPDYVKTVIVARTPVVKEAFSSRDGRWRAEIIEYSCLKVSSSEGIVYEQLKLVSLQDANENIVDSEFHLCEGLGAYGFGGLYWSSNSRFFYYSPASQGSPDGQACYWNRPMNRVEAQTGRVEKLVQGILSPDKTTVVMRSKSELILWSLDRGEIARMEGPVPGEPIGAMDWSPNGQSLVYLQTASECFPFGKSSLVRLDLAGQKQTVLLESENPSFGDLSWDHANQIVLLDEAGKKWSYNLDEKKLEPVQ